MDSRKLNALGYQIAFKLKFSGLAVVALEGPTGEQLLLVSSVFHGPAWPQIYESLSGVVPGPRLMSLGSAPAVIVEDSPEARQVLESLFKNAKATRQIEVHIEDIGFVDLDRKPTREFKHLVMPAFSAVVVVALGFVWISTNSSPEEAKPISSDSTCIVDVSQLEFQDWLSKSLGSQSVTQDQVIEIRTELGELAVVVESTIGSAAKVTGIARCPDGRELAINHRVDSSGAGAVLELGQ